MGQAKCRGTKEERVKSAKAVLEERDRKEHLEMIKRQKIWEALTPEEQNERVGAAEFWSRLQGMYLKTISPNSSYSRNYRR